MVKRISLTTLFSWHTFFVTKWINNNVLFHIIKDMEKKKMGEKSEKKYNNRMDIVKQEVNVKVVFFSCNVLFFYSLRRTLCPPVNFFLILLTLQIDIWSFNVFWTTKTDSSKIWHLSGIPRDLLLHILVIISSAIPDHPE